MISEELGIAGALRKYTAEVVETDVLDPGDIKPILLGLFGEVGGIMSTTKKLVREKFAYAGFRRAAEEEFGDSLWYFVALCRRLRVPACDLFSEVAAAVSLVPPALQYEAAIYKHLHHPERMDASLFRLGRITAALMQGKPGRQKLREFVVIYLEAVRNSGLDLFQIMEMNRKKVRGSFISPPLGSLVDFDAEFEEEEQLPREFRVRVNQRESGKSYLQWKGVFIGDPLTDNSADRDGYRFHDVFHLAHAAILHWSPVVRALTKQKRKSSPPHDEVEDGGRAIVVEEGLTALIFSRAKELRFFEGQDSVSLGLLKTVNEFVSGYEVQACPLKLWERAILDGYAVFRQIREAQGGWVVGDRGSRTIRYESLEKGA